MGKRTYRSAAAAAVLILLALLLALPAAADFTDLEGHWAQAELTAAAEKGWLTGFEDGSMRPDGRITGAQAAVLLCRMLNIPAQAGEEQLWYAPAVEAARELGFWDGAADPASPLSRRDAFCMIAEAFQTYGAQEDRSLLDTYADAAALEDGQARPIASLVNAGAVRGYAGELALDAPLTRAEFAALLSRLTAGGAITDQSSVSDWQGGTLWVSGAAGELRLKNIQAGTVVIRGRDVRALRLSGCQIGTLVLAQEGELTLSPSGAEALRIGTGSGRITLSGRAEKLEVTGSRSVSLQAGAGSAAVSANGAELSLAGRVDDITVTGRDCTLTVSGTARHMAIYGSGTVLEGRGTIREVYLRAPGCTIPKRVQSLTDDTDYGIWGLEPQLEHPELLPAGETLTVTARLPEAPAGLECLAAWLVDGQEVDARHLTLQGDDTLTLEYDYFYTRHMSTDSRIRFVLSYITEYGETQTVTAECVQKLENYPDDYVFPMDPDRILTLVTTEYQGDYTLEWALEHDYEDFEKEIWVNTKGYSSSSPYLIWINQSCQRVNIFQGSTGNWKLIRSGIVGCGANATSTPRGVFETTWNQPGWFTSTYDVRPVVRFYGGGYAFHSRLYYPGTDTLLDPGIGYPISHGCIRMYDEDIQWIYDNVPSGTTVVSF